MPIMTAVNALSGADFDAGSGRPRSKASTSSTPTPSSGGGAGRSSGEVAAAVDSSVSIFGQRETAAAPAAAGQGKQADKKRQLWNGTIKATPQQFTVYKPERRRWLRRTSAGSSSWQSTRRGPRSASACTAEASVAGRHTCKVGINGYSCDRVASLVTDVYSVTVIGLCNRCSVTVPNALPWNAVPERLQKPGTHNLGVDLVSVCDRVEISYPVRALRNSYQ